MGVRRLRIPLWVKLSFLTGVVVTGLAATLVYTAYRQGYHDLEERFGLVLKHVAINTALRIDGKVHRTIIEDQDPQSFAFQSLRTLLREAMEKNYLTHETLYTFHVTEDAKVQFAVMLHKEPFIGSPYNVPAINRTVFDRVISGQPAYTPIYTDDHGMWISGLAPIFADGKVVGIVEADFSITKFVIQLQERMEYYLMLSGWALLLALIVTILLAIRFTQPIRSLKKAAAEITNGNLDLELQIESHDELGELEQSFNRMTRSLRERYIMLKYISPHTIRMIQRHMIGSGMMQEARKHLVIFFADIRGFTAYSENRPPEEIIHNLNLILGKQAALIEKHGGEIDKFVGDEIVATFEGDKAAGQALQSAIAIQTMVAENLLNPQFDAALKIGIGIANGDVVIGNIGSEDRRDFTIIGSNVNLASRICSAAAGGEILITDKIYAALGTDHSFAIRKKGMLRAKGFSDLISIYSCQGKLEQ